MSQPTSKARLVITALFLDNQSPAEVAARYGVHRAWVYKLKARYEAEGDTALEPRSRRPKTSPNALAAELVDLIARIRKELTEAGLDAGPETIAWHLEHQHGHRVSRSTISRHLTAAGLVTPEPKKRPKSSYIRFQAGDAERDLAVRLHPLPAHPSRRPPGADAESITWLDDCTRYALHVSAHPRITTPIVVTTFREALARHGIPTSTLTDNGMVYTVRFAGGRGGRNSFEDELRRRHVVQKNSRPGHPTTCGKAERFQQTMKKWLRAQPVQPTTIVELQALLDLFVDQYNHRRPHRSLPHRATPATLYDSMPKALPGPATDPDTHERVRHDRVDKAGSVTLRHNSRLHHIGVGRTHAGTCVILLVQDLQIRIVNAATGELLRELILDPSRDYQPTGAPKGPTRRPPK
ncbi:integrase core domain-containing protein [Nocardioides sp. cx-169]|uniref:integrase core domain-containing protein n=1 Tax=Nocardioides sp. cx-169 TaxID=2899080 RepID=UPI001E37A137|nr:integrase core domain-containing protein [Nocardioides sp. cx-169]MCD4536513.1 integrase core domain-containing protein [Nocardioides sp. cx-169]